VGDPREGEEQQNPECNRQALHGTSLPELGRPMQLDLDH
jgi:hypothetical protein